MKKVLKYAYLSKEKLKPKHVDECIDILNQHHQPDKMIPTPLTLWRTLFKYDKFLTPSSNEKFYNPYSFPGDGHVFLSFASTAEKYQIYEQFKTMPIFPKKMSPLQVLSYCQNIEELANAPKKSRVGGFSFNPNAEGSFFTFSFIEDNPNVLNLMESVNIEVLIRYLAEKNFKSVDELAEVLTDNPDFYMDINNMKLPLFLPYLDLLKYKMYMVELNDQMIAFSGSRQLEHELNSEAIQMPFNELLEKVENEKKDLLLWYEHDDNENPVVIKSDQCSALSKQILFVEDCNEMLRKSFKNNVKLKK
eukprot:gene2769-4177_t